MGNFRSRGQDIWDLNELDKISEGGKHMITRRIICIFCICSLLLCSCSNLKYVEELDKWDCTVTCAQTSKPDSYIITYSNETIVTSTGVLTIQNQNDFDIKVHLLADREKGEVLDVGAGGITVQYQLDKKAEYSLGIHADVEEGTEIKVMVYDGEEAEPF